MADMEQAEVKARIVQLQVARAAAARAGEQVQSPPAPWPLCKTSLGGLKACVSA